MLFTPNLSVALPNAKEQQHLATRINPLTRSGIGWCGYVVWAIFQAVLRFEACLNRRFGMIFTE